MHVCTKMTLTTAQNIGIYNLYHCSHCQDWIGSLLLHCINCSKSNHILVFLAFMLMTILCTFFLETFFFFLNDQKDINLYHYTTKIIVFYHTITFWVYCILIHPGGFFLYNPILFYCFLGALSSQLPVTLKQTQISISRMENHLNLCKSKISLFCLHKWFIF